MRFRIEKTKDGSHTLFDANVGESYKSRHAAATEVEAVFFGPGVRENPWLSTAQPFRILELGLGLGTNFQHGIKIAEEWPAVNFEFSTIENDLSGAKYFIQENLSSTALEQLVNQTKFEQKNYSAALFEGDFFEVLTKLKQEQKQFHSIFFDPFSPSANPEAWSPILFQLAADLLPPQGRLVTYSVSRIAKDGCAQAGLLVEKRKLPDILQKRGALLAIKAESSRN